MPGLTTLRLRDDVLPPEEDSLEDQNNAGESKEPSLAWAILEHLAFDGLGEILSEPGGLVVLAFIALACVVTTGPINFSPACSPDGQWVSYQAIGEAGTAILKIPIDGGPGVTLEPHNGYAPAVSPDGKMVVFASLEGTVPNFRPVWNVIPSGGGAPLYHLNADVRFASRFRFTPDGKSLAYVATERGVSNIWAQPLAGGAPKQLTDFKSDLIFDFA
jgi:Tol biopolymer transport system component